MTDVTLFGFAVAPFGTVPAGTAGADFPPLIGNWSPFRGAVISRVGAIQFDVTDDYGVVGVSVQAVFPTGVIESIATELLGFSTTYKRGSGRKRIANGYHYVVRRSGGWPKEAVRIDVTALDLAGNVGTGQASFP